MAAIKYTSIGENKKKKKKKKGEVENICVAKKVNKQKVFTG